MEKDQIIALLPEIFQQTAKENNPLSGFLSAMEIMHSDSEEILKNLDTFFDPARTKESFIPFLLKWVDLDWMISTDLFDKPENEQLTSLIKTENLRELIANAWYLSKWRGTAKGLIMFLEIATGINGFKINETVKNEDGETIPFHIAVHVPEGAEKMIHIIELIIEKEKPAYVTNEIKIWR